MPEVAVWASRSGQRLAYLAFNDSEVELVTLRRFSPGTGEASDGDKVRYPKVKTLLLQNSHQK